MSQEGILLDPTPAGECKTGTGTGSSRRRVGLVVTGALGAALVALYAGAAPFLAPALRKVCLPFVPATAAQVENVLAALRRRSGPLVDIGSGDGRIVSAVTLCLNVNNVGAQSGTSSVSLRASTSQVIAAAKRGFQASGFELNPWLVWFSRYKAWREGVHASTSFHMCDLWKVSFAQYSNVVIFGVPQMMQHLELKLERELPSAAKVVACRFPFPTWVPEHTAGEGIDTVWVYDAGTFKSRLREETKGTPEQEDTIQSHT